MVFEQKAFAPGPGTPAQATAAGRQATSSRTTPCSNSPSAISVQGRPNSMRSNAAWRVAAVAADTKDAAEQAAALVKVEYEELPAIFDPVVHSARADPGGEDAGQRLGHAWTLAAGHGAHHARQR